MLMTKENISISAQTRREVLLSRTASVFKFRGEKSTQIKKYLYFFLLHFFFEILTDFSSKIKNLHANRSYLVPFSLTLISVENIPRSNAFCRERKK